MAGIFNLFGGIPNSVKGDSTVKPLIKSKSTLGVSGGPTKILDQPKPKGLSIRSYSDLNVSSTSNSGGFKQDACNTKQHELLKPKLTQVDSIGRPISPTKNLTIKKPDIKPEMRSLSPTKELSNKKPRKVLKRLDETTFKKPLPPKKFAKTSMPEPETLAPYCDPQLEFDEIYTKIFENDFKELFIKKKGDITLYEDEGFESDPEKICVDTPMLSISTATDDIAWEKSWSPKLPDISDDDDDDF